MVAELCTGRDGWVLVGVGEKALWGEDWGGDYFLVIHWSVLPFIVLCEMHFVLSDMQV